MEVQVSERWSEGVSLGKFVWYSCGEAKISVFVEILEFMVTPLVIYGSEGEKLNCKEGVKVME